MNNELDFSGQFFSPSKALNDPSCTPPVKNAQPLDSLIHCEILLNDPAAVLPSLSRSQKKKKTRSKAEKRSVDRPTTTAAQQVANREDESAREREVMRIEYENRLKQKYGKGPLQLLSQCMALPCGDDARRIRVWMTSTQKQIENGAPRDICTGELIAFDKHLNVMLKDVTHEYSELEIQYRKQKHISDKAEHKFRNRKRSVKVYVPRTKFVRQMFIKGNCIITINQLKVVPS